MHVYDIARAEALAGPQGTLYGASSQAGTIRIITNKPDPSKFAAGYDIEGNMLDGEAGYVAEGFRQSTGERKRRDPPGRLRQARPRLYQQYRRRIVSIPPRTITINNADRAKKDYNDVETHTARVPPCVWT